MTGNFVRRSLLLGLFGLSLAACDPGIACTEEAHTSLTITTVDAAGELVQPDSVVFTVDGGVEREAGCADITGDGICESFFAGVEEAGLFVVTATRGASSDTAQVEVQQGVCHVESETLTLVLE